jgi:uncharacterized protein YabN with tetrapyrrole methylase and pyrophosphatase domain
MTKSDASLVVVGTGIKVMSHLTMEAAAHIKQADKVLYSLNEPMMEAWVKENGRAVSLDEVVPRAELRKDTYQSITEYIVANVEKPQHVCVVFYGHPCVFARSAIDAAVITRQRGIFTKILPGVSAEDCLFADLFIDPGSCGCQSYEATDILLRQRQIDPTSHLVIWQIGMLGNLTHHEKQNHNARAALLDYLAKFYPLDHEIIAYEAALYPHTEARIESFVLKNFINMSFSTLTTLYFAPLNQRALNAEQLSELGIKIT